MEAGHDSTHLAHGAAGALLDMPRDLAHAVNSELLDVVTLLRAASGAVGSAPDDDGVTDAESRTVALLHMADDKVRAVLRSISPFV